jgi:hypothetical protein
MIVAAGMAGRAAWRYLRPYVLSHELYRIDPDQIVITPPPHWIRGDVRAEVVRDGSLDRGLSALDPLSVRQIADAFEFHPWVARVVRVINQRGPRIVVELQYRCPRVMVQLRRAGELVLLPADDEGMRLPDGDFTSADKETYPRLVGIREEPLVGTCWTDPHVAGAARLVAFIGELWQQLDLVQIVPGSGEPSSDDTVNPTFELIDRRGTRIVWGTVGDSLHAQAVRDDEKLTLLRSLDWLQHQSEPVSLPKVIDLRQAPTMQKGLGSGAARPFRRPTTLDPAGDRSIGRRTTRS